MIQVVLLVHQAFNVEVQEAAEANSDMEAILYEICDDEMDDDNDPTNNSAQFDLTTQNDAILRWSRSSELYCELLC